jgi:hypothetical protein
LIGIRAGDSIHRIGDRRSRQFRQRIDRLVKFRLCVLRLAGSGYVRASLGAAYLYANATQRHGPSRETLAVWSDWAHRNGPSAGAAPRPFVSELPAGGD